MRSPAMSSHRCSSAFSGKSCFIFASVFADVFRVTGERDPAERPLAAAEQRPDVGRHEARVGEGGGQAFVEGDLADVVAVVDHRHAERLEAEHGLDVGHAALRRGITKLLVPGWVGLRFTPALERPAGRQVAMDEIVGRGLVGDEIGRVRAGLHPAQDLGHQLGRVAEQAHRDSAAGLRCGRRCGPARRRDRWPARRGNASAGESRCAIAGTRRPASTPRRKWPASGCAPPMPPRPAVRIQRPASAAAEVLAAGFHEGLVSALHDALAADVDPRAGRHLAVHHQALAIQFVEVLPGGPLRHKIRVGDEHAR